jgi:hypothetical protein
LVKSYLFRAGREKLDSDISDNAALK